MNFYIKDFGCRINQYEARVITKNLLKMGNNRTELSEADIILINTCSVTHRAEKNGLKYLKFVRRMYPAKEVIAIGCYARDKDNAFKKLDVKVLKSFKYLDNPRITLDEFYGRTRAFIKVQQCCLGQCSYCNVRRLKKPYFIKEPENIIREIKNITEHHPEILLAATNFDEYEKFNILIKKMYNLKGNFRWRFSSITHKKLTIENLEILAADKKLCRHFHIPLQSASDKILQRMRRKYKLKDVITSMETAMIKLPGVVFSFDIIVGFPGETEQDFLESLNFITEISPVKVHIFRYSDRSETPSFNFKDKIEEKEKRKRMLELKKIANIERKKHFKKAVGSMKEVVLEKNGFGYSRDYLPVEIKKDSSISSDFTNVKITEFTNDRIIAA